MAVILYRLGVIRILLYLRRRQAIVLRYHRILPEGERPFYDLGLPRSVFEAQLDFLQRHFRLVTLDETYNALFGGDSLGNAPRSH